MATSSGILRSHTLLHASRAAQIGWLLFALFALSLALPGIGPYTERLHTLCHGSDCFIGQLTAAEARAVLAFGDSLDEYAQRTITIYLVTYLLVLIAALSLIWRKPTHPAAVCGAFVFTALGTSTLAQATAQAMPVLELPARMIQLVHVAGLLPFFCLIPDGRFRAAWAGWVAFAAVLLGTLLVFDVLTPAMRLLAGLLIGTITMGQFIYRYGSLSREVEQEPITWALVACALFAGAQAMGQPLRLLTLPAISLATLSPVFASFFPLVGALFVVGALTCIAVALLNDELFRIDMALNRALVYSLLTLFVVGGYVLIVGYLSLLFQESSSVWFSLIATGLVAVCFQPIRERVQRIVNQLLYGERSDPYRVIARLGRQLEATIAPSDILPTLARTVREALKLPYAAITLGPDPAARLAAATGSRADPCVSFPLTYQGATVGHLLIGLRRGETQLSPRDERLLTELGQQVGVAVHGVQVMADLRRTLADLQRTREQLVLAREEERRRIRRDLHDDLAPTLAGMAITAGTINTLIATDPTKAALLARDQQDVIREAVSNIRRLVYDLRPPTLDELGLLAAIRERAAQYSDASLTIAVEAPDALPPLPAAVEVAAYRIVQEALMNVFKHAQARHCTIRLALADSLCLEVTDDGKGLGEAYTAGVGLRSIHERAAELGGTCAVERLPERGTHVLVRLPLVMETADEHTARADR